MSYLDEVKYAYRKLMAQRKTTYHRAAVDKQLRQLREGARIAQRGVDRAIFMSTEHAARTPAVNRRTSANINLSKTEHGQI